MKKIIFSFAIIGILLTCNTLNAQLFTNYSSVDGLPDDYICGGLAVDADNNIWAGTASGLGKFDGTSWSSFTTADGLIYNLINCVAADSSGNIWIGTNNGVSVFNGTTWDTITTADGLINNSVYYIFADTDGGIWFATSYGITHKDGAAWNSYTTADGLLSNSISYIAQGPDGTIWVATQMGGYAKFTGTSFTSYSVATIDSLASDNVFALAIDQTGNQYIGTWSGISEISSTGTWVNNIHSSDGLFNDFIVDLKIGASGNLWALCFDPYNTIGGLSGYNGASWYSYTVADGLASNLVIRLVEDLDGNIWVATGSGVSKLNGTLGIENQSNVLNFNIAPNPATDFIEIATDEQCSLIRIINSHGQVVFEKSPESTTTTIETSAFSQGIYIVQVSSANSLGCRKLVIR